MKTSIGSAAIQTADIIGSAVDQLMAVRTAAQYKPLSFALGKLRTSQSQLRIVGAVVLFYEHVYLATDARRHEPGPLLTPVTCYPSVFLSHRASNSAWLQAMRCSMASGVCY